MGDLDLGFFVGGHVGNGRHQDNLEPPILLTLKGALQRNS